MYIRNLANLHVVFIDCTVIKIMEDICEKLDKLFDHVYKKCIPSKLGYVNLKL